ncbi:class I SAM-dependent methyltransferase [Alkanindiges illinoisensis]|uniref:class I SAM-dependent methyltransferase n=1 Tax=Alkanindiges illinoisensis TaxID=197183 RepID=UPI00047E00F7|nr:class I SAM-dependent methyltransferase [Alkanindiges illinoisensis]
MNTKTTQDLSPHRHISFTAHYTGYIWYLLGISHERLATAKGKQLATLLHPFETLAEKFVGHSVRSTLKLRHRLIDQRLEQLIAQHPDLQIIEIAAGLSPRGWRFRQKYPAISYIEVDLPAMATTKREALQPIDPDAKVYGCDIFSEQFQQILKQDLDHSRPIAVLSEGLINYFSKDLIGQLSQILSTGFQQFPNGYFISDLYPEPTHRLAKVIWHSSKLLKFLSKSEFQFYFTSPQEAAEFFKMHGFKKTHIRQASNFEHPEEQNHLGDIVWIVDAQV